MYWTAFRDMGWESQEEINVKRLLPLFLEFGLHQGLGMCWYISILKLLVIDVFQIALFDFMPPTCLCLDPACHKQGWELSEAIQHDHQHYNCFTCDSSTYNLSALDLSVTLPVVCEARHFYFYLCSISSSKIRQDKGPSNLQQYFSLFVTLMPFSALQI